MSETIFNWLNTQCNFSPNILNIENEFANGYNFGKLLHINNLFDNMDQLKNTNKKEDSIKNYTLVRKALDKIDVHLTDSDINELINKKKYKAELYLFKIKQKFSLKNCQFNEIMEKMNKESITNKKIDFDLILKNKKRNQSAKPNFITRKNDISVGANINMNNYYNRTNANIGYTNRNVSESKNGNKINFTNYTARLKSAKLPNLNKNKKDRRQILNNDTKDNEQEIQEEKQIRSVLDDIKIFENLHMSKNPKKMGITSKNPWDRTDYIYSRDLFNRNKNEEKKKMTILDLVDFENKKDSNININNNKNNIENKISKLKSTLNNHNQFNVDNKKSYINKKIFENGLFKIGINANTMLPSIAKIKDKNIPSEVVMKSIKDTIKEQNFQKLKQKKNLLNQGNVSPKNKNREILSLPPRQKKSPQRIYPNTNRINKTSTNKKRPFSSANTYNNKKKDKNKNNIDKKNIDEENKKISHNMKRPLTAKEQKFMFKTKEINEINKKNKESSPPNEKNKKRKNKKFLTKIEESNLKGEEDSFLKSLSNTNSENKPNDNIEDIFFKNLHTEKNEDRIKRLEIKKTENLLNKKYMKEIVSYIIDITEIYYDYQKNNDKELIDIQKWNEISYKFIHNKPIIKSKKKKNILTEEEIGNLNFDINSLIDEEYSKNYTEYEISEMKNYINGIGEKYDTNKNNLFFRKMNLKEEKIEINDVMGEEIQILFDKAKAEGKDIRDEDDEEEFKRTGKIRYHPSREEEELIKPYKEKSLEYNFSSLLNDIINYKDKNENIFSSDKIEKEVCDVIEEPKIEESFDNNEDEEKKNLNLNDIKENEEEIKSNKSNIEIKDINNEKENEKKIFKDLLDSIPIKISFVGTLNNEIKITIKNSLNKYPKMKIYNPIEFLKDLRAKKKKIDEPIDEQNLRKYQVEQLKKEKNILTEEIKDYINMIENKDNLIDDEIYIKILQKKIKEDFEIKNKENIKNEIIKKRENVQNITNELNKVKEEQQKKQKINQRELQVYQQQLDKIDSETLIGFVIINFPNTFEQSKLMEEKMMNFIQPCEKNKSNSEELNNKLLLLCDKKLKENIFLKFNSFLEKMIYFYCDNSKLIRENPPQNPHNNMGIAAQNEQVTEFTETQIEEHKNNFKMLENFYENFNLGIDKYDYYEGIVEDTNNPNNFNNNINMNSNNFMIRDKIIVEKIKEALTLYEEYIVPQEKDDSILEEEDDGLDATQMKEKDSSRKISGDSTKQVINNMIKPQPQAKDSNNSSSLKNNDSIKQSPNNNIDKEKLVSQKKLIPIKLKFFNIAQLSETEIINFYKIWYNFNRIYNYYICRLFYRERTIKRKNPEDELKEIQKKFINFLCGSNEQKIIVNQFIQKYKIFKENYCSTKKIKTSSNITIIENYQKDLVELNETLWDIAKIRKNKAFEEISKVEKENYIKVEMNFIYFKMERLIILETQKLITIINLFIRYYAFIINPKILYSTKNNNKYEFNFDILLSNEILKNVNEEEYAIEKGKSIIYPRANRLYKNCFKIIIKIYIFLEKCFSFISSKDKKNINYSTNKSMKIKKNKTKISNVYTSTISVNIGTTKNDLQAQIKAKIRTYINKYKYEMYNLYVNTLENLSKIFCPFKQVLKLMDYWIILFMELQNKNIQDMLKILDLTNNYKRDNTNTTDINNNLNYEIEKKIVDSIIKDENNIYNYEYIGIKEDKFTLFDKNKFLGISNINKGIYDTDKDSLILYELFKELDILTKLKNNEIQKGIITKSKFEEIFFKYFVIENIDKMPNNFKNIDYHQISKFLSHFIIYSNEFSKNTNNIKEGEPQELIYTNDIITILLLSCISFSINKDSIENKENKNNYIDKNKYMSLEIGFENEINKITDKGEKFKSYLFNIHKNNSENPEININHFLNLLSLKTIKNAPKDEIKKYFQLFDI